MDIVKKFFRAILPDEGHYCVVAIDDRTKSLKKQLFVDSVDEVITKAAGFTDSGYGAFYAMASYVEGGDNAKRDKANCFQIKSFWIDIDVGQEKAEKGEGYATAEQAYKALEHFCKKYKLPKPTIIVSGGGLHVYWILTAPIPRTAWHPVAVRLRELCIKERFLIDTKCTSDSSRILRVPFSLNFKPTYEEPQEVRFLKGGVQPCILLDDFAAALEVEVQHKEQFDFSAMKHSQQLAAMPMNSLVAKISADKTFKFSDMLARINAGNGCAQLEYIVEHNESLSEPLWRAGLSIAKCCEDAKDAAVLMSDKHPEYSWEATEEKMMQTGGAYHCTTFDAENPNVCEKCPHFNKLKTPLDLIGTVKAVEAEQEIFVKDGEIVSAEHADDVGVVREIVPVPPTPYIRGENGGVYERVFNPETETYESRCIFPHDLYIKGRVYEEQEGEHVILALKLPHDGLREFVVPGHALSSGEELRKRLGARGISSRSMKDIMGYLIDWNNELINTGRANPAHRQYGWTNDRRTFVLGPYEFTPTGVRPNSATTKTAASMPYLKPHGTLEAWKATIDAVYNQKGKESQQYAIGLAFGAPLMRFSNQHGMLSHLLSKGSGKGKTTVLLAALSVMGNPSGLICKEQDTVAFKFNRTEVYKDILVGWDEMTNSDGETSSNTMYQMTQGMQRGRMFGSADIERARGEPWHTLFLSTGNSSILERIGAFKSGAEAEALRMLEIPFISGENSAEDGDMLVRALHENYGHAGHIYIKYLVSLGPEEIERRFKVMYAIVIKKFKLTSEYRYWLAGLASNLLGLTMAKELNLVSFDLENLLAWMIRIVQNNREVAGDLIASADQILNDFYAEHINQKLEIVSTADSRSGTLVDFMESGKGVRGHKLVMRYEPDTENLFIMVKPFKDWCVKQQLSYGETVTQLEEMFGASKAKVRMGKGTNLVLPPANVICIPKFKAPDVEATDGEE